MGDRVVLSSTIVGFDYPKDLDALTTRTLRVARETLAAWDIPLYIGETTAVASPALVFSRSRNRPAAIACVRSNPDQRMAPEGEHPTAWVDAPHRLWPRRPGRLPRAREALLVTITNASHETWQGRLSVKLPAGWEGPESVSVTLPPGEAYAWSFSVRPGGPVEPVNTLAVRADRLYADGRPWAAEEIPFTLVAKWAWTVTSPRGVERHVLLSHGELPIEQVLGEHGPGEYRARTVIHSPIAQEVRVMVALVNPTPRLQHAQIDLTTVTATAG